MKKMLVLAFLLFVVFMFVGGCTSTESSTSNNGQSQGSAGTEPQNQEQARAGGILQPPPFPED